MRQTTDPQDEPFDVLDADGQPTGVVKPRGEVHRDGDWHRGLHIWVYGFADGSRPYMLFQRRSLGKDTWPGAFDVAVGGHFRAGESLEETLRETEEEIGLVATLDELVRLGTHFMSAHGPGWIDRELHEVFALRCDQPLLSFHLHPEEVAGIVALDLGDARALFEGTFEHIPAREVRIDGSEHLPVVARADFAGKNDVYPLAVMDSILALSRGLEPEPFLLRPQTIG